jgi:hypothetical protein
LLIKLSCGSSSGSNVVVEYMSVDIGKFASAVLDSFKKHHESLSTTKFVFQPPITIQLYPILTTNHSSHPVSAYSTSITKRNQLNCYYTNATSLNPNKIHELEVICAREKFSIIAITETWFNEVSIVNLPGYKLFNKNRAGTSAGYGGVAIYTSLDPQHNLVACEIDDNDLRAILDNSDAEQIWCQLRIGNEKILFGCIYRSPSFISKENSSATANAIFKSLKSAKSAVNNGKYDGLCIVGDFNFPDIHWDPEGTISVSSGESSLANQFVDLINDISLHQFIIEPTYIKSNGQSKNTLDLVFAESNERINEVTLGPPLGNAKQGHKSIKFEFTLAHNNRKNVKFSSRSLNYRRGDYSAIDKWFKGIDWHSFLANKSVGDAFKLFLAEYRKACERHIPVLSPRNSRQPPWVTERIIFLSKMKKSLWHSNQRLGWKCVSLVKEYKSTRNLLKKEIKCAIRGFELNLAKDKSNPKRLFSYVNHKQKVKTNINAIVDNYGTTRVESNEIANVLNDQFSSVFVVDDPSKPLPLFNRRPLITEPLNNALFTQTEIITKLKRLNEFKSPGPDKIHPAVLKNCADSISLPLLLIFNISMSSGEVPNEWLEAYVSPIFKKGSRLTPANYRPVSLTSIPCKIMESLVRDRLMGHLRANRLINSQQHGFVPGKACVTNLLETFDYLTKNLGIRKAVDLVFLDFAKAFDKVSHHRLLYKLEAYGIVGNVLSWIKAFLSNRIQRVVLGEHMSNWARVTSGVPQGSVLGPTLFIIFVNDLPEILKNKCKLYADDCKIMATVDTQDEIASLQSDIDAVVKWSDEWLMQLNAEKCKIMHLGKKNISSTYTMLDSSAGRLHTLAPTTCEKDLGIFITSDLKTAKQASYAASKANSVLGQLKKTFVSRDLIIWKKLYTSYIRPHLEFGVAAWNPYLKKDIAVLEKTQRRVTKVPFDTRHLQYPQRLARFDLTNLETRRLRGDLIQLYKINNGLDIVDWDFKKIFVRDDERGQYRREIVKNFDQRHHFFTNRIVNDWNRLPDDVVNSDSVKDFKCSLDKYFKSRTAL